jgi:dynein heavy chain, axonemal
VYILSHRKSLILCQVLRPDRLTLAVYQYIVTSLGTRFMEPAPTPILDAVHEANQATPLLFILSPGVDPFKDVEDLARRNGFTLDNGSFLNVALGDGQEEFATRALKEAHAKGGWVMLQSIILTYVIM